MICTSLCGFLPPMARDRFVLNRLRDDASSFATVHIGFLQNDNKGTRKAEFIPDEFLQHLEEERDSRGGTRSFSRHADSYKAREKYGRGDDDPFNTWWIRKAVRNFFTGWFMRSQDFKHCELAFDKEIFPSHTLRPVNGIAYGSNCLVAYGTNLIDGQVFRKPRTFMPKTEERNDGTMTTTSVDGTRTYEWINLRLPRAKVNRIVAFLDGEKGKTYDPSALERMLIFPQSLRSQEDWDYQKWHCTNLTIVALQQAGFLVGLDPNSLTADDVYDYMKDNEYESPLFPTPVEQRKKRAQRRNLRAR